MYCIADKIGPRSTLFNYYRYRNTRLGVNGLSIVSSGVVDKDDVGVRPGNPLLVVLLTRYKQDMSQDGFEVRFEISLHVTVG